MSSSRSTPPCSTLRAHVLLRDAKTGLWDAGAFRKLGYANLGAWCEEMENAFEDEVTKLATTAVLDMRGAAAEANGKLCPDVTVEMTKEAAGKLTPMHTAHGPHRLLDVSKQHHKHKETNRAEARVKEALRIANTCVGCASRGEKKAKRRIKSDAKGWSECTTHLCKAIYCKECSRDANTKEAQKAHKSFHLAEVQANIERTAVAAQAAKRAAHQAPVEPGTKRPRQ
jgi:pullulanase/glycogen debranching enzyme